MALLDVESENQQCQASDEGHAAPSEGLCRLLEPMAYEVLQHDNGNLLRSLVGSRAFHDASWLVLLMNAKHYKQDGTR